MKTCGGALPIEEGLAALTVGTAATAATVLYCGVYGSDIFLVLVGFFACGVAAVSAGAYWTRVNKLIQLGWWLHWVNLVFYFAIGFMLCTALTGSFHWEYARSGANTHRSLLSALQGLTLSSSDSSDSEFLEAIAEPTSNTPDKVWALGGALVGDKATACHFPFYVEEKKYTGCVSGIDPPPVDGAWTAENKPREHPWCMTNTEHTQWGYCLSGAWMTGGTHTIVHTKEYLLPFRVVLLLLAILLQLSFSSFAICVLDGLHQTTFGEAQIRSKGQVDSWRAQYQYYDSTGSHAYAGGMLPQSNQNPYQPQVRQPWTNN